MLYFLRQINLFTGTKVFIDLNENAVTVGYLQYPFLKKYSKISDPHALLTFKGDQWFIQDLDSKYGTFVNGFFIGRKNQLLDVGDQIGLGDSTWQNNKAFVCALSVQAVPKVIPCIKKEEPEVIDLTDDEPPVIKKKTVHDEISQMKPPLSTSTDGKSFSFKSKSVLKEQNRSIEKEPKPSSTNPLLGPSFKTRRLSPRSPTLNRKFPSSDSKANFLNLRKRMNHTHDGILTNKVIKLEPISPTSSQSKWDEVFAEPKFTSKTNSQNHIRSFVPASEQGEESVNLSSSQWNMFDEIAQMPQNLTLPIETSNKSPKSEILFIFDDIYPSTSTTSEYRSIFPPESQAPLISDDIDPSTGAELKLSSVNSSNIDSIYFTDVTKDFFSADLTSDNYFSKELKSDHAIKSSISRVYEKGNNSSTTDSANDNCAIEEPESVNLISSVTNVFAKKDSFPDYDDNILHCHQHLSSSNSNEKFRNVTISQFPTFSKLLLSSSLMNSGIGATPVRSKSVKEAEDSSLGADEVVKSDDELYRDCEPNVLQGPINRDAIYFSLKKIASNNEQCLKTPSESFIPQHVGNRNETSNINFRKDAAASVVAKSENEIDKKSLSINFREIEEIGVENLAKECRYPAEQKKAENCDSSHVISFSRCRKSGKKLKEQFNDRTTSNRAHLGILRKTSTRYESFLDISDSEKTQNNKQTSSSRPSTNLSFYVKASEIQPVRQQESQKNKASGPNKNLSLDEKASEMQLVRQQESQPNTNLSLDVNASEMQPVRPQESQKKKSEIMVFEEDITIKKKSKTIHCASKPVTSALPWLKSMAQYKIPKQSPTKPSNLNTSPPKTNESTISMVVSNSRRKTHTFSPIKANKLVLHDPKDHSTSCIDERIGTNSVLETRRYFEPLPISKTSHSIKDDEEKSVAVVLPNPSCSTPHQIPLQRALFYNSDSIDYRKILKNFNLGNTLQICIILHIVRWNAIWLEEQKNVSEPPPDLLHGVTPLPVCFQSLAQYVENFVQMILLEAWENVFQASLPLLEDKNRLLNRFYFVIVGIKEREGMFEFWCDTVVNGMSCRVTAGSIVILETIYPESSSYHQIIGYVHLAKVIPMSKTRSLSEFEELAVTEATKVKLCRLKVFSKLRLQEPVMRKLMRGNSLCNVKNIIKPIDAIKFFRQTPFHEKIIHPDSDMFFAPGVKKIADGSFNHLQKMAIDATSTAIREAVLNCEKPLQFILWEAYTSTGKIHTITGLLQDLFVVRSTGAKIIIASSSSEALEKTALRITEMNKSLSRKINYLLGFFYTKAPKNEGVWQNTLERLYKKLHLDERNKELKKIINEIRFHSISNDKKSAKGVKHLVDLNKRRDTLKKDINEFRIWSETYKIFFGKVLEDYDVFLISFKDAYNKRFANFFRNRPCTACIILNATQHTELELLPVINLGVCRYILIGDPRDVVVSVRSEVATTFGYRRSLFGRFREFVSPKLFTLSEQYRMHSSICAFPSEQFYHGTLTTAASVDSNINSFPLWPYAVFDIASEPKDIYGKIVLEEFTLNLHPYPGCEPRG